MALTAEGDFVLRHVPLLTAPHATVDYMVYVLGLLMADKANQVLAGGLAGGGQCHTTLANLNP